MGGRGQGRSVRWLPVAPSLLVPVLGFAAQLQLSLLLDFDVSPLSTEIFLTFLVVEGRDGKNCGDCCR